MAKAEDLRKGDALLRRIDLRTLRVALAVTDAGSMLRAADRIGLSQPAVSRAIKGLEQTLGMPVFERGRRGVVPTREGFAVLARARAALDELRMIAAELAALADPEAGEIRIGASPIVCAGFLPTVLAAYAEPRPKVSFRVVEIDSERQVAGLIARDIDIGIGRDVRVPADESIESIPLYGERLVVVAGESHGLAKARGRLTGSHLASQRWLLPPQGSALHDQIMRALAGLGVPAPEVSVSAMSIPLRTSLLATGRFLAVLHESMLARSDGRLVVLPIELNATVRIGLMRLKSVRLSPTGESFAFALKEFCASASKKPDGKVLRTPARSARRMN